MDFSIFDSLIDSVFIINKNREILYCNECAAAVAESSVRRLSKNQVFHKHLTFSNKDDYDKILEDDMISTIDLASFAPGKQITLVADHEDGSSDTIRCDHTYNENQINWFKAGSALNLIKEENK